MITAEFLKRTLHVPRPYLDLSITILGRQNGKDNV